MNYKTIFLALIAVGICCAAFVAPVDYFAEELPTETEEVVDRAPNHDPCLMFNSTFEGGERLVYDVAYNWNFVWLSAGAVTFDVEDKGDRFELKAEGKTYESYEWFYKVKDLYESDISKETLLPTRHIQDIQEGKHRHYDKIFFNQDQKKAVSHRGKTKFSTKKTEYELDKCMHDLLSIFYFCRNLNFDAYDKGDQFPIEIFMDKKTHPLRVTYLGKKKKKIKGVGTFKTHCFAPELMTGDVFKEDSQMKIYVTDDKNQIPILIESDMKVGSIKATLKSYRGLKYDMEAKK